jgi:hypothetical protein
MRGEEDAVRPLRLVIDVQQASDGLIYEVLECSHWRLITTQLTTFRPLAFSARRCKLCPRLEPVAPTKRASGG